MERDLHAFPSPPNGKSGWPWDGHTIVKRPLHNEKRLPRISIVTPSYNQVQFLEETIRSVLLQGYRNLEYIVIDGGSTDGSVEIIKRYSQHLDYWASAKDRGQSHAINNGFNRARGEIFGFLNSDDVLAHDALFAVAEHFLNIKHKYLVISFAGVMFSGDQELKIVRPSVKPRLTSWLTGNDSLFQPATFWSRQLYERIGGFKEDFQFCFDKEFFLRAIFEYGHYVEVSDTVVAKFRIHNSSKTSTLEEVMLKENRSIRDTYSIREPYATILRREAREERYDLEMNKAFASKRSVKGVNHLFKAGIVLPKNVFSRFYLGAWKKVLAGALGFGEQNLKG